MATIGFELLHSSASASFNSIDDAAVSAVHWNLVTNGLKCCGSGDSWPEQTVKFVGSELLPPGWNVDTTVYSLRYIDPTSDRKYLLKIVAMDESLIVHLVRCYDEKTVSTSIKSRDFVNDRYSDYQTAFTNLGELNTQLNKEIYNTLIKEKGIKTSSIDPKSTTTSSSTSSSPRHLPQRSPLMEDPRRGVPPGGIGYTPPRVPFGASPVDPFAVGRADLDPFSAGVGGGMLMDPRNFPGRGGFGPMAPIHPGFPPGSIPPGARFDPIGPPGVRPNPDPDHERPPGYDDMFM